ncbi:hypothetical protein MIMGU_mgv1a005531mg [Erythranthe guttata]|uniref:F-box domain-containing protein n=1 Tax=Erythranthe guttata TaxID=4155 RepID=A0A022R423_ERYGU|nr:PREDICTED: F-box/kelch-repeat protein At1g22040-like [Erythranthe guttata]EYU35402.1 hypothetical protein MIMGU_mgv1a005531mg [Erythranthe guttata]|eukprot:XP_012839769.1 PREDICTED: F-box/kelch-repeat protein At1g22040-like [Erythranthe guttata]
MGAKLSSSNHQPNSDELSDASQTEASKRQRTSTTNFSDENERLFPDLPDEISIQILARLPRIYHLNAKRVSTTWKSALTSDQLFKLRKELNKTEEWLYVLTKKTETDKLVWYALDPISGMWQRLPPMPNIASTEDGMRRIWSSIARSTVITGAAVRNWLCKKKKPLEQIPFCGCSIGAIGSSLYVIGGFSWARATSTVFRYDPILNAWSEATPMANSRAYSKTAVLDDKLYVVGGVTRANGGLTPLQSAEAFDPLTGKWSELPNMPFSKGRVLPTAFLAEMLKPIATGMVSYRGKIYVPQSLYCWPFYVDVGGEVYDPETNSWAEMPAGMGEGWPARQAGNKMSVVVDGDLYALDPSSSSPDSGRIKMYDCGNDSWKVVKEDVPIGDVADPECKYLLAGFLGNLHVVAKDVDSKKISVMRANKESGCDSSIPTQSLADLGESLKEYFGNIPVSSSESVWQVVGSRSGGSVELLSCQSLEI